METIESSKETPILGICLKISSEGKPLSSARTLPNLLRVAVVVVVCAMAPNLFTPNVYALDGAFGVANPESQPTAPLSELQSVFALDGSTAQARGLQRRRVKSTPWNQGSIDQQNNTAKWTGFQCQPGNSNDNDTFFQTQHEVG